MQSFTEKVREACDSRPEFDNIRHYWGNISVENRDSGSVLVSITLQIHTQYQ